MESEQVICSSAVTGPPDLRFLHYNDVYHIEEGSAEPVGGIARFQTLVNHYRGSPDFHGLPDLITCFSGDAFNPSLESSVTKGRHMVPVLNGTGVDVACVGNHDLDFGVPQFRHLRDQCTFPWLLANVLDPALGMDVPLANCPKSIILTSSNGIKIGVLGLGEREWLSTINSLPPNLEYRSAAATAKELIPPLRAQGCEMIIALTHARQPSDEKLARNTPNGMIDLILGGHDHFYEHDFINGTHILRSGTDFKQLSYLEARRCPSPKSGEPRWDLKIVRRDVVRDIAEDPASLILVDQLTSNLRSKLEKPIGYTAAPLDARFITVRTRESNIGNFVCDLMRHYYNSEIAMMAGGTIRGDQIYPPGILRLKDILNCFPFEDPVVVIKVSGQGIWEALENGVSLCPALEGRFPQVAGIKFAFDPSKPSGKRILWATIGDEPLDRARLYTLATRGYMARGKDGFTSLLVKSEGGECEELVSEETGMLISAVLRQYFLSLKVLRRWRRWGTAMHEHWSGIHQGMHESAGGAVKEPGTPFSPKFFRTASNGKGTEPNGNETGKGKDGRNGEAKVHGAKSTKVQTDGHLVDSDTDDEEHEPHASHTTTTTTIMSRTERDSEREKHIMRTVSRKWMRLAGIQHQDVGMVDEAKVEFLPDWTRGIAPVLEGRVVVVDGSG